MLLINVSTVPLISKQIMFNLIKRVRFRIDATVNTLVVLYIVCDAQNTFLWHTCIIYDEPFQYFQSLE